MRRAETAQNPNVVISELQRAIDRSGRTPEELLADGSFRAGVVQFYQSTVGQETDSKLRRIQAFLRDRRTASPTGIGHPLPRPVPT